MAEKPAKKVRLKTGEDVMARGAMGKFYPGKVNAAYPNGTYAIAFSDGSVGQFVPAADIVPLKAYVRLSLISIFPRFFVEFCINILNMFGFSHCFSYFVLFISETSLKGIIPLFVYGQSNFAVLR
jgi:hypothetical protein